MEIIVRIGGREFTIDIQADQDGLYYATVAELGELIERPGFTPIRQRNEWSGRCSGMSAYDAAGQALEDIVFRIEVIEAADDE